MRHKNTLARTEVTLRNKISLIIFGIFFCVILLEIGLRLGGFIFISLQEHGNLVSIRQKGTYRIMCLGESTTARLDENSYPSQLEKILNQRNIGVRFSVINKGVYGVDSTTIVAQLEDSLNKYCPAIVIVMMGANDEVNVIPYENKPPVKVSFLTSFRTYKLVRLLWLHAIARIKEKRANLSDSIYSEAAFKEAIELTSTKDKAYVELGRYYLDHNEPALAEEAFKKAMELSPSDDRAYIGLGWSYQRQGKYFLAEQLLKKASELNPQSDSAYIGLGFSYNRQKKYLLAEESFKKAIEVSPQNCRAYAELGCFYQWQKKYLLAEESFKKAIEVSPQNATAYVELGYYYVGRGRMILAEESFKKAIEVNPRSYRAYAELGWLYQRQKRYTQAEGLLKKAIELNPENEVLYGSLIMLYEETGDEGARQDYNRALEKLRQKYYNPATYRNYQRLKAVLDKRGIKLACVQYPMRNIEPLERIFQGQEGVIFVDNEKVFKEAVSKEGYKEYFVDMFGGDFGHCTPKGNKLLAENITNTILREIFHK